MQSIKNFLARLLGLSESSSQPMSLPDFPELGEQTMEEEAWEFLYYWQFKNRVLSWEEEAEFMRLVADYEANGYDLDKIEASEMSEIFKEFMDDYDE